MGDLQETIRVLKNLQEGAGIKKAVHEVYPKGNWNKKEKEFFLTKDILWKLFQHHSPLGYKINSENREIIFTVLRYFLKDPTFNEYGKITNKASLSKGLLIYGSYGVGKSLLFEILLKCGRELVTKVNCNQIWFNTISAGSFIEEYMKNINVKESNFDINNYYRGRLYIDDLGFENKVFKQTELLGRILFERNRNGAITYVTTNLSPKQLQEKYGLRIGDRLFDMFNIIPWQGKSFRE